MLQSLTSTQKRGKSDVVVAVNSFSCQGRFIEGSPAVVASVTLTSAQGLPRNFCVDADGKHCDAA